MPAVDPDDVTALLDHRTPAAAEQVVPIITTMAKAYTRGRGFDGNVPNDEIAAVITTASARLASNSLGLQWRYKVDEVEHEFRNAFTGWTLAELFVLKIGRAHV